MPMGRLLHLFSSGHHVVCFPLKVLSIKYSAPQSRGLDGKNSSIWAKEALAA